MTSSCRSLVGSLEVAKIDDADIDRYLGTLEARVRHETNGKWTLDSLSNMDPAAKPNVRMRTLVAAMIRNQEQTYRSTNGPWRLSRKDPIGSTTFERPNNSCLATFFTVRPSDVIDLAASLMECHVRHVPVEDDHGHLVGLVSHRDLIAMLASNRARSADEMVVADVMKRDLLTISPETPTLDALYLMRERGIGCLPVCKNGKLVGMITAHDFLTVSTRRLEERLTDDQLNC